MAHEETDRTDRRTFLQAGAAVTATALSASSGVNAQDAPAPAKSNVLPKRVLGKTGVEITMLDQGLVRGAGYDRIIRQAFASGVRVFDAAKVYGNEPALKRWFDAEPAVRKQIFLVTKDMPRTPAEMPKMVDQRLANLGTDYIDLFFLHSFGDNHSLDDAINFVTCKEFKETCDAIKKSGKVKFIGFSSHHKNRAQIIEAAAKAGIIDAMMVQYTPWLEKDSPLNKALDVAHEKKIGIISMKQIAAHGFGDAPKGNILEDVVKKVPMLSERKLSPFQGLLHAIWTDERISSACVSMRTVEHLRENVDAARRYEPLKTVDILQLRDAMIAKGPTLCADCDGRCSEAAGTKAELGNLTRFLTYHEHHGDRSVARQEYAKLSDEARNWSGADLEAARDACPNKLNFAELLPKADRLLS